jgi:SAM-dependent methyltransferase
MDKNFSPAEWYSGPYSVINASADPNSRAFKFLHTKLEKNCPERNYADILEIGANEGEHIPFVRRTYLRYTALDLRLPPSQILEIFGKQGVTFLTGSAESLPFAQCSFDRVILTCVLHHLGDLESALREILRVTKVDGIISISVPNDPGIFYRFLRQVTSVRKAKKFNLQEQLSLVHSLEHKNHFWAIDTILRWVFASQEISRKSYPGLMKYWQLNFLTIYTIKKIEL